MLCKSCFLAWLAVFALPPAASAQWNEQVLYSFQGGTDGAEPIGGMVFDKTGNLYGATNQGGSTACASPSQCGTVFELSPPAQNGDPWIETILYVFKGRIYGDGASPGGGLVMDTAGNLYGVTGYGGTGPCTLLGSIVGCGTVYKLSPPSQQGEPWTEAVLYSLQGGTDGYVPTGDLVFDSVGNLYGATLFGGGKGTNCNSLYGGNCGTIFELSPPKQKGGGWIETVLYSFAGLGTEDLAGDGGEPNGDLFLGDTGDIYGTTFFGGRNVRNCSSGCGTVFQLVRSKDNGTTWKEKILHGFQGYPVEGAGPNGYLALVNGALYGTTLGGGSAEVGTFYELAKSGAGDQWVESTLYSFLNGHDPNTPETALTITTSGEVLGTANSGGAYFGGAVFQLMPPRGSGGWGLSNVYSFGVGSDGAAPAGILIEGPARVLYGTTESGGTGKGCQGGCGTVFAVWP